MNISQRLQNLQIRVANLEQKTSGDESRFFDNPVRRNVREFAESLAITNVPEVAIRALEEDNLEKDYKQMEEEVSNTPPTPSEIVENPGGKEFSTLNQFIVETEMDVKGVPESYAELPKAEVIEQSMRKEAIRKALRIKRYR
jgi:hypothetical protein